jgi:hypothetical protein
LFGVGWALASSSDLLDATELGGDVLELELWGLLRRLLERVAISLSDGGLVLVEPGTDGVAATSSWVELWFGRGMAAGKLWRALCSDKVPDGSVDCIFFMVDWPPLLLDGILYSL